MTITEILEEIHKERVEIEVCQALQQWLLDDRAQWIDRAMDSEAIVRAIHKIATKTSDPKNALQGIINLSEDYSEDSIEVYYEDYRLKVVKNQSGKYNIYDTKYGKITHNNVSKEQADERVQQILSIRNRRKNKIMV